MVTVDRMEQVNGARLVAVCGGSDEGVVGSTCFKHSISRGRGNTTEGGNKHEGGSWYERVNKVVFCGVPRGFGFRVFLVEIVAVRIGCLIEWSAVRICEIRFKLVLCWLIITIVRVLTGAHDVSRFVHKLRHIVSFLLRGSELINFWLIGWSCRYLQFYVVHYTL